MAPLYRYRSAGRSDTPLCAGLKPVEIHLEFMTASVRLIMALKLCSVLSARMTMRCERDEQPTFSLLIETAR